MTGAKKDSKYKFVSAHEMNLYALLCSVLSFFHVLTVCDAVMARGQHGKRLSITVSC